MSNPSRLWMAAFVLVAALAVFFTSRKIQKPQETASTPAAPANATIRSANRPFDLVGADQSAKQEDKAIAPSEQKEQAEAIGKIRRSERGQMVDRSKLPVVNVEANMEETPPWPDGPRVLAEVATEKKRFINMRPNELGILPTTNVGAKESVMIKLDFPDNAPGDKIYVELVDGGEFLDSDKAGQVRTLGEVKTLEVSIATDSRVGILKLQLRQNGHTRVVPFWVGPPAPIAESSI